MDERALTRLFLLLRVGIGSLLFVAPRASARVWTGERGLSVTGVVATRGLAARDVAIGLGGLIALKRQGAVRAWVEAGAVADAGDALSCLLAGQRMSVGRRTLCTLTSASAAVAGLRLASED